MESQTRTPADGGQQAQQRDGPPAEAPVARDGSQRRLGLIIVVAAAALTAVLIVWAAL